MHFSNWLIGVEIGAKFNLKLGLWNLISLEASSVKFYISFIN